MNHQSAYIEGKDILMEDLRQKCLFKVVSKQNNQDKWWEYMQYVHKMCYEEITEDCSKLGHKNIGIDYDETLKCISDSFDGSNF